MSPPALILFGCWSPLPDKAALRRLQHDLASQPTFKPLLKAFYALPDLWRSLLEADKELQAFDGLKVARNLSEWASSGNLSEDVGNQNSASLPITVASQLVDFTEILRQNSYSYVEVVRHSRENGGIQGLCTGLLCVLAVAGSESHTPAASYGELSVYVAFAIGVYVELDRILHGATISLAMRWKIESSYSIIRDVVNHAKGHVAIKKSPNEAVINIRSTEQASLTKRFKEIAVELTDLGISGRYHAEEAYEGIASKISVICCRLFEQKAAPDEATQVGVDGKDKPLSYREAAFETTQEILAQSADWQSKLADINSKLDALTPDSCILCVGPDAGFSALIPKKIKIIQRAGYEHHTASKHHDEAIYPDDAIAIVGMSCKLPGVDSPKQFWDLLREGRSMVERVPFDRWPSDASTRGISVEGKYWGNFMSDVDSFDHKFFRKSAREAMSMDPQQRLLLQGAYEAMESARYFAPSSSSCWTSDIGCYIGLCAVDYDANVASHPPSAFSSLGTLRAFISGKISHFFGWSGPSLTIDTACSSSAVAINTACKAIQHGECSAAIAGGISLFGNSYLWENLAAAHFLSPTGQTKPFDAGADGYCRGEGLGIVVLKSLKQAMVDGSQVLAVIGGSALNQNENCVSITVPHSNSQSSLYSQVMRQARVKAEDIAFVEAHGTGTPVGDPIEMESIRHSFCGPKRQETLIVSSVKGNIGHLEGASGVAGLIKAILQIQHRIATPQASYRTLNPKIPPLAPDRIVIPTSNLPLPQNFIMAFVNNYGAAGSNSSLLVMQPPAGTAVRSSLSLPRHPILIAAHSETSIRQYLKALLVLLGDDVGSSMQIDDIAFKFSNTQNQTLSYRFVVAPADLGSLKNQVTETLSSERTDSIRRTSEPARVVLAFGGQTRAYVGLAKNLWHDSFPLKHHLDSCDVILRLWNLPSLYPSIFQVKPIEDIATLHAAIFSIQYASALAWIDSGLRIEAVVGHSIGQITALTVSGVLSLEDGLRFVIGRANIIREHWGSELGTMLLVQSSADVLKAMLPSNLDIACYNGSMSQVVVGDRNSIENYQVQLSSKGIKCKRLPVTHGFHSRFAANIIGPLQELAQTLTFMEPTFHIETCSDGLSWSEFTPDLLTRHTRDPVHFDQAVTRLVRNFGPITWLEAGSDSGITSMVRDAMLNVDQLGHTYLPLNLSNPAGLDVLVDITLSLWNTGHCLQFWGHQRPLRGEPGRVQLPPYQWEKIQHWLELPSQPKATLEQENGTRQISAEPVTRSLIRLGCENDSSGTVFHIDPLSDEYKRLVSGRVLAGTIVCPATVYMELAARACKIIDQLKPKDIVCFQNLDIEAPLGAAQDKDVILTMRGTFYSGQTVTIASRTKNHPGAKWTTHCSCTISLDHGRAALEREFATYERILSAADARNLLDDRSADYVRGQALYKLIPHAVNNGEAYHGTQEMATRDGRSATAVTSRPSLIDHHTVIHCGVVESWLQVGEIHANAFCQRPEDQIYVITKLDRIQWGPDYVKATAEAPRSWTVLSTSHNRTLRGAQSDSLTYDMFIFDAISERLVVLILGVQFTRVRPVSFTRLSFDMDDNRRNNWHDIAPAVSLPCGLRNKPSTGLASQFDEHRQLTSAQPSAVGDKPLSDQQASRTALYDETCALISLVLGISSEDIRGDMDLDSLGVDSLFMIEVISELSNHFGIKLKPSDMVGLETFESLVTFLEAKGCRASLATETPNISDNPLPLPSRRLSDIATPSTYSTESLGSAINDQHEADEEKLVYLLKDHLELPSMPELSDNLASLGVDSLFAIELISNIEKLFSTRVDLHRLDETSTIGDLAILAGLNVGKHAPSHGNITQPSTLSVLMPMSQRTSLVLRIGDENRNGEGPPSPVGVRSFREAFRKIKWQFDAYAQSEGFSGFWKNVYPSQRELVLAYSAETLAKLGRDIRLIPAGIVVKSIPGLGRHERLIERMFEILEDGGYVDKYETDGNSGYVRSTEQYHLPPSSSLLKAIETRFPLHAQEHRLLNVTASRLPECLSGTVDPLTLLFADKDNRQLLADVYDTGPMCRAITRLLADFIASSLPQGKGSVPGRILEVGGGTGGTARYLVKHLSGLGCAYSYTFTDLSSSLVASMERQLAAYDCVAYKTLNINADVAEDMYGKFDIIVSTNCVHATPDAVRSISNLKKMLRPGGVLAVVEFTTALYWFDLVYGLLEGWWVFEDGRKHALGDAEFWQRSMAAAGFRDLEVSQGLTKESQTLRLICGFDDSLSN